MATHQFISLTAGQFVLLIVRKRLNTSLILLYMQTLTPTNEQG